MAIARIAYSCLAPLSIHGSSKRFRELVTYRERTPISSVSRVRNSYIDTHGVTHTSGMAQSLEHWQAFLVQPRGRLVVAPHDG